MDPSNPVAEVTNTFADAVADTDYKPAGYVNFAEAGGRTWRGKADTNSNMLIQATAYGANQESVISWFVTPALNVDQMAVKKLTFDCVSAYYVEGTGLEVYFLEKNGETLTQTKLNVGTLPQKADGYSDPVTLSADLTALAGKIGFIGFKYIGGGMFGGVLPVPIIIFAIILAICFLLLYKTRYGRYVFAVGGNANAARVSGINIKRIIASVYILSGVLAALAGVITSARVTSGVTNTGEGYETDAIAMVVIGGTSLAGGKGRLWGTVVGILLMVCLSSGLDMLGVSAYYQMMVKGFVVILAVMLDGLSSD